MRNDIALKRIVWLLAFCAAFAAALLVVYGKDAAGQPGKSAASMSGKVDALHSDPSAKPDMVSDKLFVMPRSDNVQYLARQAALWESHPNDEFVFFFAAELLRKQHKFSECQKLAESAVKAHPSWITPYVALASVAHDQGDDDAELDFCNKAIAKNPLCISVHERYVDLLRAETRYKESIEAADRALRLLQEHTKDLEPTQYKWQRSALLSCKGRGLLELKDIKGGIACLTEVHALWPIDIIAVSELSKALIADKQAKKAADLCAEGLRTQPDEISLYLIRAQAFKDLHENQKAIDDLSLCLKKLAVSDPYSTHIFEVRVLRATLYDLIGKKKLADDDRAYAKNLGDNAYKDTYFRTK